MPEGQFHQKGGLPQTIRSRPIKFTPERLEQIKNLVERGKGRDEIADMLGVTVGSLQVTCSKMGISLRRPKIDNGMVYLPRTRMSLSEHACHRPSDQDGRVPLQPTEEQSQGSPVPDESPSFAISFRYRGRERRTELTFTPHAIVQLALEAALQDVKIGDLIAKLITALVNNKELFTRAIDNVDPTTDRGRPVFAPSHFAPVAAFTSGTNST